MKYFLNSSITRHVTATGTIVTIIQIFLGFLEIQTSSKYGIDSNMIESISNYTIRLQLMEDAGILCQLISKR